MDAFLAIDTPSVDWAGLSPLLVMAGAPLLFLTIWSLISEWAPKRIPSIVAVLTGIGTIVAAAIQWNRVGTSPRTTLADAYEISGFSMGLTILIAASVSLTALYAHDFLEREDINSAEFFVLLMLSGAGGMVMAGASDLIVLFLGLEVLSIAVYILAAGHLRRAQSCCTAARSPAAPSAVPTW